MKARIAIKLSERLRCTVAVAVTMIVTTLWLALSDAGTYLERTLFLRNYFRAAAALGASPKLDPRLRLVILDDRALAKIGRYPTFSDWQRIADILAKLGYERVIIGSFVHFASELGAPEPLPHPGSFWAAGVAGFLHDVPFAQPEETALLGGRLLARQGDVAAPTARSLIGANDDVLAAVDGLGLLNADDGYKVPDSMRFGDRYVVPYLGLLALPGLAMGKDGLVSALGPLPRSLDGTLFVDYPKTDDLAASAVAASAFFNLKESRVSPNLGPNTRKLLAGGKIALLITAAFTGGRELDTAFGEVPAFYPVVAMASSALQGRFIYQPIARAWLLAGVLAAGAAVLAAASASLGLGLAGLLLVLTVGAAAFLLRVEGWYLPAFGMGAVLTSGMLVRLGFFMHRTWRDRLLAARDLEMGRTIQSLLLPGEREGALGAFSYRIVFAPYGPMSGDWFQAYHVKDPASPLRCVLGIGDVVGKGPSAALNTATIAAVWRAHEETWEQGGADIPRLLRELHHVIQTCYRGEQNTTAVIAAIFKDRLQVISCASPNWLQVRPSGEVVRHRNRPLNPLGMRKPQTNFQVLDLTPGPGDILIAHTDGIMDGAPTFSRFCRLVRESVAKEQPLDFATLTAHAVEAGRGEVQPDDVTMLLIQRHAEATAAGSADAAEALPHVI